MEENNSGSQNIKKQDKLKIFYAIVLLVAVIGLFAIMLPECSSGTKTDSHSATCHLCHKTFTYKVYDSWDYHNVRCIQWTNMCKKCYKDFCYLNGITPKDY